MSNLASAYEAARKLVRTLSMQQEVLKLRTAKLGPHHQDTLTSMCNLAHAYQATRRLDLAVPLLEETLPLMRAYLGRDHPLTLTCMGNLAEWRREMGDR
jgi:hypothetical protein